jgi:hypothetical protein
MLAPLPRLRLMRVCYNLDHLFVDIVRKYYRALVEARGVQLCLFDTRLRRIIDRLD